MALDRANIGWKNSRERTPIPSGSHTFNYLNFIFIASYNKCRKQWWTIEWGEEEESEALMNAKMRDWES